MEAEILQGITILRTPQNDNNVGEGRWRTLQRPWRYCGYKDRAK